MDPNAGKKNMFNKLSKSECLDILNKEDFSRKTVSFYRYVILKDLSDFRDELYKNWNKLAVLGRIYIAKEGINAQLSVPEHHWEEFIENINSYKQFQGVPFKFALEDNGKSFFKLTVKIRDQIVADGLSSDQYDVTNVGKHLSAKEWNKSMANGAVVVDMRNHYESEIGKFKGAICPQVETFKEELPLVREMLQGKEKEQILLYCTGGIRCEKTSAYLKHYGFENVNQLYGGIINYVRELNEDKDLENKFQGRNFVFDERRSEKVSKDIISSCHQCGEKCDTHVNCKNVNCNLLFLQCASCKEKYENCCSIDCVKVLKLPEEDRKRLRSGVNNQKKYYKHKKVNLSDR